jgi:tRNA uridine 5-carboxymethylaminomethyl modification enzyme
MQMVALEELLRRPFVHYPMLASHGHGSDELSRIEQTSAEIDIKYAAFIKRQQIHLEKDRKRMHRKLPNDLDYSSVHSLSSEAKERLTKIRPSTLGQASRLEGVNPADMTALLVHLEVHRRRAAKAAAAALATTASTAEEPDHMQQAAEPVSRLQGAVLQ